MGLGAGIESGQIVGVDQIDQLGGVGRVGRVPGRGDGPDESGRAAGVECRRIAGVVAQEVTVIQHGIGQRIVGSEIVPDVDILAGYHFPGQLRNASGGVWGGTARMTFHPEERLTIAGQFRLAPTRFEDCLGHGDRSRHAIAGLGTLGHRGDRIDEYLDLVQPDRNSGRTGHLDAAVSVPPDRPVAELLTPAALIGLLGGDGETQRTLRTALPVQVLGQDATPDRRGRAMRAPIDNSLENMQPGSLVKEEHPQNPNHKGSKPDKLGT